VAFLRGGVDARPQLAIVSAEGGEPRIVTDAPLGVDEFVWSRDSRELAFVARMPEEGRYGTLEGVPAEREDPRLIVGNKYQANGIGYIRDRPRGIYLLEVPSLDEEPWLEPRGRADLWNRYPIVQIRQYLPAMNPGGCSQEKAVSR